MWRTYPFAAVEVCCQKTSLSFVDSIWEIFGPLLQGVPLVIIPDEVVKDPEQFVNALSVNKVTRLVLVPSLLRVMLETGQDLPRKLGHLRYCVCSGETLPVHLAAIFREQLPNTNLINLFGSSEVAADVTCYEVDNTHELSSISIGRPIANTDVYILDSDFQPVPGGATGEICVGGEGLARGYLNRATLTAERFVPHPFCQQGGARMFRTGDIGRYLPDGTIEYRGRRDHQVKIRGFRIELGEVESALRECPAVRESVVTTLDDEYGTARLIAYVTFDQSTSAPTNSELRVRLLRRLPEHMVPSIFMTLDEMPLTPNGKIDRSSLPQPNVTPRATEYVEPANEIESKLVEAWERILNLKNVGISDNYFDLGGDSIRAIQIAALLHQQGLGIRVRDLFQFPTIAAIAPQVRRLKRVADQSPVVGPVRPTPFQMDFLGTVSPKHRHHFNHGVMLHCKTTFDTNALAAVFAKLLQHHDALRLTLNAESLTLFNEDAKTPPAIVEYDLRETHNAFAVLPEKATEIQASINLETGPLMKFGLIHMPDGDRLVLAVHHMAVDGVSWRILCEDLQTLYQQHVQGLALTLPPKTDSFKSWSEFLAVHANSEQFLAESDYWAAIEATPVPLIERDGDDEQSYVCDEDRVSFVLSADETDVLLTRVNKAFNTEVHHILLAALGLAVTTCFGHSRAAIAIEGHGREPLQPDLNVSRTVGWFTSIYPVVLDLSEAVDLSRLIKNVKETLRRVPHNGIGHGLLKHLTKPELKKHLRFNLAPQITFNYHGQFDADLSELSSDVVFESPGKLRSLQSERMEELGVSCSIEGKRLHGSISFSRKQHRPEKIEKFCQHYQLALLDVLAHCSNKTTTELTPSDLTYKGLSIDALDQFFMDHS
jgi:non-ribosomal peptide synthase protein (TIGR01720 family)